MLPLFNNFLHSCQNLPIVNIGLWPTPVKRLNHLIEKSLVKNLYIKQDNQSGKLYGGNKVRKLEFLLGDAYAKKADTLITYGGVGSNHVLATALYGRQLGLDCHALVCHQPNTSSVQRNILNALATGATYHLCHHFNEIPKKPPHY